MKGLSDIGFVGLIAASLYPRLWPAPKVLIMLLEPLEETVLVRLGGNGLEAFEYADELVEALEACLKGLGELAL